MDDVVTTWWLWDASIEDRGTRVVLEVRTAKLGDEEIHTPVGFFAECDSGMGVDGWMAGRIMIDNEQFARLRAEGAITSLTPTSRSA